MAGALGVVLVGERRAEEGHDAIAGELVDRTLVAVDLGHEDLETAVQDLVDLLRVQLLGQRVYDATSAKSTVTILRSPSRAEREVRILSARCLGV